MSVEFDMSEVKALSTALDLAGTKAEPAARIHTKAAAVMLGNAARSDVAVRSGETRDSIRVEDGGNETTVVADSDAAFFLEFGTSDTAPQSFLWSNAPAAAAYLAEALEDVTPFTAR